MDFQKAFFKSIRTKNERKIVHFTKRLFFMMPAYRKKNQVVENIFDRNYFCLKEQLPVKSDFFSNDLLLKREKIHNEKLSKE